MTDQQQHRRIGNPTPGSPCPEVWASEAALAQAERGRRKLQEAVEELYDHLWEEVHDD